MTCPPHYTCATTGENDVICCPGSPTVETSPVTTPNTNCQCDLQCPEGYPDTSVRYKPRSLTSCCVTQPNYNNNYHYECVPDVPPTQGPGDQCATVRCQHAFWCHGRYNPNACCGFECLDSFNHLEGKVSKVDITIVLCWVEIYRSTSKGIQRYTLKSYKNLLLQDKYKSPSNNLSGGSTYKSFRRAPPPNRTKFFHFYICFH